MSLSVQEYSTFLTLVAELQRDGQITGDQKTNLKYLLFLNFNLVTDLVKESKGKKATLREAILDFAPDAT